MKLIPKTQKQIEEYEAYLKSIDDKIVEEVTAMAKPSIEIRPGEKTFTLTDEEDKKMKDFLEKGNRVFLKFGILAMNGGTDHLPKEDKEYVDNLIKEEWEK